MKIVSTLVADLTPHPRNIREGDVGAIVESLTAHGQYRPIVVQKATGIILAGNHTWKAAKSLGWAKIDVVEVDVSDDEALRILLVDNRTNDLATYDRHALTEVLEILASTDAQLEGTGYDLNDLDGFLSDLNKAEKSIAEVLDKDKPSSGCPNCGYQKP